MSQITNDEQKSNQKIEQQVEQNQPQKIVPQTIPKENPILEEIRSWANDGRALGQETAAKLRTYVFQSICEFIDWDVERFVKLTLRQGDNTIRDSHFGWWDGTNSFNITF